MIWKNSIFLLLFYVTILKAYQETGEFLGKDNPEERLLGKRRRPSSQGSSPCNFGNGYRPKNQGTGRTFFDLQFFNVEHSYNLEINCGGNGENYPNYPHPAPVTEIHQEGFGEGHKPLPSLGSQIGGGGHRPHHKPGKPSGGGGFFQGLFGGGNNPQQTGGPFNGGPQQPGSGSFAGAFAGILPSPHDFATGLSEGLQGFIGTLPAIGQSFQSILPSFENFQWPQLPQLPQFNPGGNQGNQGNTGPVQFGPVFQGGSSNRPVPSNPFNGPPSFTAPTSTFLPVVSTSPPFVVTTSKPSITTDPDDIIYNDGIKPVHEDYDPITDQYNNRPFGANGKYRPNSYYSRAATQYQNYRRPSNHYNRNDNFYRTSKSSSLPGDRPEGRSFSFPS